MIISDLSHLEVICETTSVAGGVVSASVYSSDVTTSRTTDSIVNINGVDFTDQSSNISVDDILQKWAESGASTKALAISATNRNGTNFAIAAAQ